MRKFAIMVVAALWPLAAVADDVGYYVGIHGGGLLVDDSDVSTSAGSATIEFDPGFAVGGIFGYKTAIGVRIEGEYTYRRAGLDDACAGGTCLTSVGSADGHVDAHAIMANAWYEPRFGSWRPYVGGGAGIGIVGYEATLSALGVSASDDGSDTVFAYQVGGGIGYELTANNIASVGYRYWATTDPDFDGAEAEVATHAIMVEIRNTF
jgi:opacity protein-like surface antigen